MKFEISWAEPALKDFEKMPVLVQRAIARRLDAAAENPAHYFERLAGRPHYKLRMGDYRVIARIVHDQLLILVVEVGHRKNIYD
jgi:mRNA interferase RelE/StbE